MSPQLVFAGDLMLAGGVGRSLLGGKTPALVDPPLRDVLAGADLSVANLECCIVAEPPGSRPGSPVRFCAPPPAADAVAALGIGCVSLANNHAGDAGRRGLAETMIRLAAAGVATIGTTGRPTASDPVPPAGVTGPQVGDRPALVAQVGPVTVGVVAFSDHGSACPDRNTMVQPMPGAATGPAAPPAPLVIDLQMGCPVSLLQMVSELRRRTDAVVVYPHWGPNFSLEPTAAVRVAAVQLLDAGADLVIGHSAHVLHGVAGPVAFDLGGLVDDYPPHPLLRADVGLLCAVDLDGRGGLAVELIPVVRRAGAASLAVGADYDWAADRLQEASAGWGTTITDSGGRLRVAGGDPGGGGPELEPDPPQWWR